MPGHLRIAEDTGLNDSDKTITLDTTDLNKIQAIQVNLITTATVGNRNLEIIVDDGTNELFRATAQAVQAASLTRNYSWAPDGQDDAAFINNALRIRIPNVWLPSGSRVRVFDFAAIDAAADDMVVRILYERNRPS